LYINVLEMEKFSAKWCEYLERCCVGGTKDEVFQHAVTMDSRCMAEAVLKTDPDNKNTPRTLWKNKTVVGGTVRLVNNE
jgi:hypothetical protein